MIEEIVRFPLPNDFAFSSFGFEISADISIDSLGIFVPHVEQTEGKSGKKFFL